MFHFEAIRWGNGDLWWLMLVPLVLVAAWISYELFHKRVAATFSGSVKLGSLVRGPGFGRRLAAFLCFLAALELLSVAAMRPRYGLKDVAVKGFGVDIAIVLDASRSMKVNDIAPDRLGASIIEISRLLDSVKGNRVALVPFAGISFIQSPLTVDHGVIKQYMNDLRVSDIPVQGTALGRALTTASRALGLESGESKGSTHKAIIIFTDGENHEGTPEDVATELAGKGVKIFTVGVGTPEGKPIPLLDDKGVVTGMTREEDGVSPVISKLNETLLKDIANKSGGKYYSLASNSTGSEVATALASDINALEKAEYRTAVEKLLEDRFQYPLAAAVVLMLLPFFWMGGSNPRGRKTAATAISALIILATPSAFAQPFEHPLMARLFNREDSGVNDARKLIAEGKFGDAQKMLEELATKLPPSPGLDYNIAMAAFKAGNFDASSAAIDRAVSKNDVLNPKSPLRLDKAALLHAKGTILAEKASRMSVEKKPPREVRAVYRQAVDALVSALILNPGNADTRRNVELAAVAAYPPCSSLDDKFEQNDSSPAAAFLTPEPNTLQFKEQMLLCPDDEDWFKLPLNKGETIFVSVEKPQVAQPAQGAQPAPDPAGGNGAQAQQKPEPADVDVSLELADGSVINVPAKQARYSAPASSEGLVTMLRVTGPSVEDGVDYVLSANVVPPCPSGDDQMEPNDSRDAAKQAEEGDLSLRVCPLNDDWFGFTEKQGSAKQVTLQYSAGDGPLELEVYTADGALMDVRSQTGEAGTVKSVMLPKAEQDASFVIRVFGAGTEGFYNLSIKDPEGSNQQNQQNQNKDEQQQQKQPDEQKPQGSRTMREMLDNLDNNGENLEAQEAARNTPMRDSKPSKDW